MIYISHYCSTQHFAGHSSGDLTEIEWLLINNKWIFPNSWLLAEVWEQHRMIFSERNEREGNWKHFIKRNRIEFQDTLQFTQHCSFCSAFTSRIGRTRVALIVSFRARQRFGFRFRFLFGFGFGFGSVRCCSVLFLISILLFCVCD